ncbi:kinase-like protein [Trematosphaeria pertusa]|uniref:Kinase-like protein n=1 Tax=Trematosphaeria pertusa TaxID=390896 RepID=A0A6A6IGT3_9PLEO|nr:kinase-like protein [Trematosphaeria pertusa]KAF2249626.1 kinase-like protein [Trematosphaeria pertusa]
MSVAKEQESEKKGPESKEKGPEPEKQDPKPEKKELRSKKKRPDLYGLPMEDFIEKNDRNRFNWKEASKLKMSPNSTLERKLHNHARIVPDNESIRSPLVKGNTLGKSSGTRVYECWYDQDKPAYPRKLALKIFDYGRAEIPLENALVEVGIMEQINHCHVVSYVASYDMVYSDKTDNTLGIVMYPAGTDLRKILDEITKQLKETKEAPDRLRDEHQDHIRSFFGFFACLSKTLEYLHSAKTNVKHKDIKPDNIIVDEFSQPLITDFGISKRYPRAGEEVTSGGQKYTPRYVAPEVVNKSQMTGYESDVFSLGCVFLEMATLILGIPLGALYKHINMEKPQYYRKISLLQVWIESNLPKSNSWERSGLARDERDAICKVLPIIGKMVEANPDDRPKSHDLWQHFKSLYLYTKSKIACHSCEIQTEALKFPQDIEKDIETLPAPNIEDDIEPSGEPESPDVAGHLGGEEEVARDTAPPPPTDQRIPEPEEASPQRVTPLPPTVGKGVRFEEYENAADVRQQLSTDGTSPLHEDGRPATATPPLTDTEDDMGDKKASHATRAKESQSKAMRRAPTWVVANSAKNISHKSILVLDRDESHPQRMKISVGSTKMFEGECSPTL